MAQMENTRDSRVATLERNWSRTLEAIRAQNAIEQSPALWKWVMSRGRPSERRSPTQRRAALELALVLAVTPGPQPMAARWACIARETARRRINIVNAARKENTDFSAAFDRALPALAKATRIPQISEAAIEKFSPPARLSPGAAAESATPAAETAVVDQAVGAPGACAEAAGEAS